MVKNDNLHASLQKILLGTQATVTLAYDEVTVDSPVEMLLELMLQLRDEPCFAFDQLIDVCGVDYLSYGQSEWETDAATETGFSRGVERGVPKPSLWKKPRFAVVYHLLSTQNNHRVRVKVFLDEHRPVVPTVYTIWQSAEWFEREAYDLFGILFENHPDLRRLLTDYGFIGHPFRKDFPVSGHVEMRYDARLKKVIYEPVEIEPRTSGPRVIRDDNRYLEQSESGS